MAKHLAVAASILQVAADQCKHQQDTGQQEFLEAFEVHWRSLLEAFELGRAEQSELLPAVVAAAAVGAVHEVRWRFAAALVRS